MMEAEGNGVRREEIVALIVNIVMYIISPILFIWAINTLFDQQIPLTFKTWLAGFALLMLARFHLRSVLKSTIEGEED